MKHPLLLDRDTPSPDGSLVVRALPRVEAEAPGDARRIPLNLSLVLDRSGSMGGDELAAAREAVTLSPAR